MLFSSPTITTKMLDKIHPYKILTEKTIQKSGYQYQELLESCMSKRSTMVTQKKK